MIEFLEVIVLMQGWQSMYLRDRRNLGIFVEVEIICL